MLKLADNWLISYASKVMFKILQARLQQYVNQELLEVQVGFRKDRGTRDQIANISWIIEKAREFQQKKKKIYFCFIGYANPLPLAVWITTNCGKFLKRWKYQTTLPVSCETYMQVKKQVSTSHGIMDDSKLGKKYDKAVYFHLCYLTSMHHTSCENLG